MIHAKTTEVLLSRTAVALTLAACTLQPEQKLEKEPLRSDRAELRATTAAESVMLAAPAGGTVTEIGTSPANRRHRGREIARHRLHHHEQLILTPP